MALSWPLTLSLRSLAVLSPEGISVESSRSVSPTGNSCRRQW